MIKHTNIGELNASLSDILKSIAYLLPEIFLVLAFLLLIIADLALKQRRGSILPVIACGGLLLSFGFLVAQWIQFNGIKVQELASVPLFSGMLSLDSYGIFFKILFCLSGILAVFFSLNYSKIHNNYPLNRTGEYYTVLLGIVIGSMFMAMSSHLLSIYLSIETVSICSYVLTFFHFDRKGTEASMKYILFGGVASGLMLYGISLLYGFTGTLDINSPGFLQSTGNTDGLLVIGVLLTIGGFLFKMAAVPFHIWAPDVYEGAPIPAVAIFSVAPKIAAVAVLTRFLSATHAFDLSVGSVNINWQVVVAVIAGATLVIGNFAALWQNNAKRLMAYSSIAHSGFILVGVLAYSELGMYSVVFYVTVYLFMNFGAFLLIKMIYQETGFENISDYKGLGVQYPFIGVMAVIVMISLVGLPPTAGFTAKLLIFSALWETYQQTGESYLFYLLIFGLFNTVISLFYYLKIPFYMYFKNAETVEETNRYSYREENKGIANKTTVINFPLWEKILAIGLIFPLLFLFFKTDWLMNFISHILFIF